MLYVGTYDHIGVNVIIYVMKTRREIIWTYL